MRIVLFCIFFSWIALFGGVGCKKSSSDGVASARSSVTFNPSDRFGQKGKARQAAPSTPAPIPAQPSYADRKAKPLPKALQQAVAGIGQTLQRVQFVYGKAFVKGKLKHWRAYYKAEQLLSAVSKRFRGIEAQLKRLDPMVAEQMQKSLRGLTRLIKAKASPQRTGHFAYAVLQAAYHAGPNEKNALLNGYRASIQQIEQQMVAQKTMGAYRVGLLLMQPRTFIKLSEIGKKDVRATIRPPKGTAHTIGVFLRDARTGVPLAGTHVSVEILGAKNKRQYSTQKLHLLWDGAPKYIGHLRLPSKDQPVIVQVTVSPFPVARTRYSSKMLRSRSTVHFRALVKNGVLSFGKFKPKPGPAGGADLMRAISLVGGQVNVAGPYKVGMALVPLQSLYSWNNGRLKRMWRSRRATCQLVVFIQDKRTGLLVHGGRIEAFVYWRNHKGNLYRTRLILHSIYDGFPSYRVHLPVKPGTFDFRLRLDPPLVSRFSSRLPATRTVHFKDIKHPSLLKRFYRR